MVLAESPIYFASNGLNAGEFPVPLPWWQPDPWTSFSHLTFFRQTGEFFISHFQFTSTTKTVIAAYWTDFRRIFYADVEYCCWCNDPIEVLLILVHNLTVISIIQQ